MHKKRVLLLLRSYGDFVIAICTHHRYAANDPEVVLYASMHFSSLYEALKMHSDQIRLPEVRFADFGIRHQILSIFTNKRLLSVSGLLEIRAIKRFMLAHFQATDEIWLEQKKRHQLFFALTGTRGKYLHDGISNIYDAYAAFWGREPDKRALTAPGPLKKLLLLPGSRMPRKQLPDSRVAGIRNSFLNDGVQVTVAGLGNEMQHYSMPVHIFSSFDELIGLIIAHDCIYCADSVAAHLCELFEKPHRVYYAKSVNLPWITPSGETAIL